MAKQKDLEARLADKNGFLNSQLVDNSFLMLYEVVRAGKATTQENIATQLIYAFYGLSFKNNKKDYLSNKIALPMIAPGSRPDSRISDVTAQTEKIDAVQHFKNIFDNKHLFVMLKSEEKDLINRVLCADSHAAFRYAQRVHNESGAMRSIENSYFVHNLRMGAFAKLASEVFGLNLSKLYYDAISLHDVPEQLRDSRKEHLHSVIEAYHTLRPLDRKFFQFLNISIGEGKNFIGKSIKEQIKPEMIVQAARYVMNSGLLDSVSKEDVDSIIQSMQEQPEMIEIYSLYGERLDNQGRFMQDSVEALSRRIGEPYRNYAHRIKKLTVESYNGEKGDIARKHYDLLLVTKLVDGIDNTITCFGEPWEQLEKRIHKTADLIKDVALLQRGIKEKNRTIEAFSCILVESGLLACEAYLSTLDKLGNVNYMTMNNYNELSSNYGRLKDVLLSLKDDLSRSGMDYERYSGVLEPLKDAKGMVIKPHSKDYVTVLRQQIK
jgi:hypothetical protein